MSCWGLGGAICENLVFNCPRYDFRFAGKWKLNELDFLTYHRKEYKSDPGDNFNKI